MKQKINSQLLMMMLVLMRSLRLQLVKGSKTKTGFFVLFLSGPEQSFGQRDLSVNGHIFGLLGFVP